MFDIQQHLGERVFEILTAISQEQVSNNLLFIEVEVEGENAVGEQLQVFFLKHVKVVQKAELKLNMLIGLRFASE